jgi:hypothetical protein
MRNDKLNLKLSTLVLFASACRAFGHSNVSFYVAKTASDSNPGTQSRRGARFNMPRTPRGRAVRSTCRVESTKNWKASIVSGNATDRYFTFRSTPGGICYQR